MNVTAQQFSPILPGLLAGLIALLPAWVGCSGDGTEDTSRPGGSAGSAAGGGGSTAGSSGQGGSQPTASAEEFAGPFDSWKNVRDYGAVGDGVADDTEAIQDALVAMLDMPTSPHAVLYFPAGTYRITETLTTTRTEHNHFLGMAIVGEDPATTTVAWDGAQGADMVRLDMWYGKVLRLTFDGGGTANVGLYRGGG